MENINLAGTPAPAAPEKSGLKARLRNWFSGPSDQAMSRTDKVLAVIIALVFLFVVYIAVDANKYQAQVAVIGGESKVGVNPTTERLDFGDLSRGSGISRAVKLQNDTPVPMLVAVVKFGSIADLIKIEPNFFRLAPRTTSEVEFKTYVPASAQIGQKYTGRVFLFKIPTFGL